MRSTDGISFTLTSRVVTRDRARALPRHVALEVFDARYPECPTDARLLREVTELAIALGGRLADDAASLRQRVRSAVREGLALAVPDARARPAHAAPPAPRPEPEGAPAATATAAKTWITVRLLTDETPPRPLAYARYRLRLPNDEWREGRLDASGTARVEGIDPGACDITFLDCDV